MFGMGKEVLGCTLYSWVSWDPHGIFCLHVIHSIGEAWDLVEISIFAGVDGGGDGDGDCGESGGEAAEVAE